MTPQGADDDLDDERAPGRPRLLAHTDTYAVGGDTEDASGAVWRLEPTERDLDANVIALPAGGSIERHVGPALDVLVHVLSGEGRLLTDGDPVPLTPGALVWLPRGSTREIRAGDRGLRYLTVHQRRRDALSIKGRPAPLTD